MDVELSASEALSIAEKIERNGARFYRRAAGRVDDAELSTLLVNLAQWESRHVEAFRAMRERLSDRGRDAELTGLERANPGMMASLAPFSLQSDPADELGARPRRADVLRLAIDKERDSVIYYLGLKDFVKADEDKKVIDEIIAEEKKHVRILMQSLERDR